MPSRVGPSGRALSGATRLKALKVTQRTLDKYNLEIERFENWMKAKSRKITRARLDQHVCSYLGHLHDEKDVEPHHAAYLIYGLQLLRNDGPKQDFLPQSKEALAGWRKEKPGTTRLPVPEEFVFDVASRMLDSGRVDIAVAMTLQLHCYLRPSEVLALTKAHVSAPSVGRYHKWGLVIAPSELGVATKTGAFDDSILLADVPDFKWIGDMMELYMKHVRNKLFPNLSLQQYENILNDTAVALQYPPQCMLPHVLRHSGPSCDHFHQRRDLVAIQKRGRWQSKSSVRRYEKHAVLLRRWHIIPEHRHSLVLRESKRFPQKLMQTLRKSGHTRPR